MVRGVFASEKDVRLAVGVVIAQATEPVPTPVRFALVSSVNAVPVPLFV